MTGKEEENIVREKISKMFGKVFVNPAKLHVQREPMPFILKRSVIIGITIVAAGCVLSLVSTATTYVSQYAAGIIK